MEKQTNEACASFSPALTLIEIPLRPVHPVLRDLPRPLSLLLIVKRERTRSPASADAPVDSEDRPGDDTEEQSQAIPAPQSQSSDTLHLLQEYVRQHEREGRFRTTQATSRRDGNHNLYYEQYRCGKHSTDQGEREARTAAGKQQHSKAGSKKTGCLWSCAAFLEDPERVDGSWMLQWNGISHNQAAGMPPSHATQKIKYRHNISNAVSKARISDAVAVSQQQSAVHPALRGTQSGQHTA